MKKFLQIAMLASALLIVSAGSSASETVNVSAVANAELIPSTAKNVQRRTYKTKRPPILSKLRASLEKKGSIGSSRSSAVATSKIATTMALGDECYGEDLCGEVYVDETSFSFDYWDQLSGQIETAVFMLEQVQIYGTCSIEVDGPWGVGYAACGDYKSAVNEAMAADTAASEGLDRIFDGLEALFAPEKLEKCAPMTNPKDQKVTLTTDRQDGYAAAARAFLDTYKGALPAVHNLSKVDIKYPDGWVYTFSVAWVDLDKGTVNLFSPVFTKTSESTCK